MWFIKFSHFINLLYAWLVYFSICSTIKGRIYGMILSEIYTCGTEGQQISVGKLWNQEKDISFYTNAN